MQTFIKLACEKYPTLMISTITTIIVIKIIALAPPLLLGQVIDTLSGEAQHAINTLIILIAAFILAGCVQATINPVQTFFLSKLVQQVVAEASVGWIAHLMRKEFLQFSSWRVGHFIKSVERGITAHEQLLTFFVTIGFPLLLELLIVGSAFVYLGGASIFFSITALGAAYLYVAHRIIRWRRKHLDAVNEQEDELSALLFNTLNSGKTIKLEGAEQAATSTLNRAFGQYANAAVTVAGSAGFLSGVKILFVSLATGGLLGWGVLDQLSGAPSISVGQLVAIFAIAGNFMINITALSEGYRILDQFLADQQRLKQLLALPNFDDDHRNIVFKPSRASRLTLQPCALDDDGGMRLSIKNAITFSQNESVAITGPSGAGKSTLLQVLAGLNAPLRGQLSFDDIPVSRLTAETHLKLLRYCPQSPQFLEGNFDRSILLGVSPSPELTSAISRLKLEDIAANRHLMENATNISGGEAKRLSLLRLINRPGLFNLFDEPSASIEPKLAEPVWDLLFDTFAGRGLICVTHDVHNLYRFNRVIVMSEGVIIDDGAWCDLIDRAAIKSVLSAVHPEL